MTYKEKRDLLDAVRHTIRNEVEAIVKERIEPTITGKIEDMTRDIFPLKQIAEEYGYNPYTLYKRWQRMGGMKCEGKIFFSRRKFEEALKGELIINN